MDLFLTSLLNSHDDDKPVSNSYFEAVSTALKRLHSESGLKMKLDVEDKLAKFLGGYSRKLAILRKEGKLKAAPGGDVIDYELYRLICIFLWNNCSSSIILFHTMLLNVGARSDNTSDINQLHFGRMDEFTTLRLPNMKVNFFDAISMILLYFVC